MAPTPQTWASSLLQRLGIHQTPGAIQALTGWERAEGGHWNNQARYNPLNTTQPAPGAGNTGSQGNIKQYTSWGQGLDATVQTLRNGRYGGILHALQTGDPGAVASAIGQTPWGTSGGLVARTIASTPRVAGVHPFSGSGGSGTAQPSQSSPSVTVIPAANGFDGGPTPGMSLAGMLSASLAPPLSIPQAPHAAFQSPYVTPSMQSQGVDSLLSAIQTPQDLPQAQQGTVSTSTASGGPTASAASVRGTGTVRVASGANAPGRGLTPGIQKVLRAVASVAGPITVGTGTNHDRLTVDGNVSDHYSGNAADLPTTPGQQNIKLGRQALIAAGMPASEANKATGGIYNVPYGQHRRIQVIFNTNAGGNHHNHVHVGVTGR